MKGNLGDRQQEIFGQRGPQRRESVDSNATLTLKSQESLLLQASQLVEVFQEQQSILKDEINSMNQFISRSNEGVFQELNDSIQRLKFELQREKNEYNQFFYSQQDILMVVREDNMQQQNLVFQIQPRIEMLKDLLGGKQ